MSLEVRRQLFGDSPFSFYCVGPGDWPQVVSLGLYPLRYLIGPKISVL